MNNTDDLRVISFSEIAKQIADGMEKINRAFNNAAKNIRPVVISLKEVDIPDVKITRNKKPYYRQNERY